MVDEPDIATLPQITSFEAISGVGCAVGCGGGECNDVGGHCNDVGDRS